jgi:hypothetical protein
MADLIGSSSAGVGSQYFVMIRQGTFNGSTSSPAPTRCSYQGLGVSLPGHDFALLWLGAGYVGSALILLRLVMSWREDALTAAQRPSVSEGQP